LARHLVTALASFLDKGTSATIIDSNPGSSLDEHAPKKETRRDRTALVTSLLVESRGGRRITPDPDTTEL
jgi:hypothetical protein